MAESIRRLVEIGTFSVLHEKLENWLKDFYINSCDRNTAQCCEVIELNAKVQGQLFKLLNLCAQEGGLYGGSSVIKSRLLPWLGQNFFTSGGSLTADTSMSILADGSAKDHELADLQVMYEKSLNDLEKELFVSQEENQDLKDELQDTKLEINRSLRSSSSDKMFRDFELHELSRKLADAREEISRLQARCGVVEDYERKVQKLRDELYLNAVDKGHYLPSPEPRKDLFKPIRYKPCFPSSMPPDDPLQHICRQSAITRFNDMFSQDRLDAMDTLRIYSSDHENNQRIIFSALYESFSAAKTAFRQFQVKTRANVARNHRGVSSLEGAVQDYINRNLDLLDTPGLVADVIRSLNRNQKLFLPPDTTFAVIQPFIREAVKLAWQMSALLPALDVAVAGDGELFDSVKYRRSYDSDYTAPLVGYHIWPALMQGAGVVVKGEVNTRRGSAVILPKRGRSVMRSLSPCRFNSDSSSRFARSRSTSPRRCPLIPRRPI